jgi:hypothetical protein
LDGNDVNGGGAIEIDVIEIGVIKIGVIIIGVIEIGVTGVESKTTGR